MDYIELHISSGTLAAADTGSGVSGGLRCVTVGSTVSVSCRGGEVVTGTVVGHVLDSVGVVLLVLEPLGGGLPVYLYPDELLLLA